jgi:hypothetical protein
MTFTHEPRAPQTPEAPHQDQRYFASSENYSDRWLADVVRVYRNAAWSEAQLNVRTGYSSKSSAQLDVILTPAEMRELAQRLLDAAHDIEAFPAPGAAS